MRQTFYFLIFSVNFLSNRRQNIRKLYGTQHCKKNIQQRVWMKLCEATDNGNDYRKLVIFFYYLIFCISLNNITNRGLKIQDGGRLCRPALQIIQGHSTKNRPKTGLSCFKLSDKFPVMYYVYNATSLELTLFINYERYRLKDVAPISCKYINRFIFSLGNSQTEY